MCSNPKQTKVNILADVLIQNSSNSASELGKHKMSDSSKKPAKSANRKSGQVRRGTIFEDETRVFSDSEEESNFFSDTEQCLIPRVVHTKTRQTNQWNFSGSSQIISKIMELSDKLERTSNKCEFCCKEIKELVNLCKIQSSVFDSPASESTREEDFDNFRGFENHHFIEQPAKSPLNRTAQKLPEQSSNEHQKNQPLEVGQRFECKSVDSQVTHSPKDKPPQKNFGSKSVDEGQFEEFYRVQTNQESDCAKADLGVNENSEENQQNEHQGVNENLEENQQKDNQTDKNSLESSMKKPRLELFVNIEVPSLECSTHNGTPVDTNSENVLMYPSDNGCIFNSSKSAVLSRSVSKLKKGKKKNGTVEESITNPRRSLRVRKATDKVFKHPTNATKPKTRISKKEKKNIKCTEDDNLDVDMTASDNQKSTGPDDIGGKENQEKPKEKKETNQKKRSSRHIYVAGKPGDMNTSGTYLDTDHCKLKPLRKCFQLRKSDRYPVGIPVTRKQTKALARNWINKSFTDKNGSTPLAKRLQYQSLQQTRRIRLYSPNTWLNSDEFSSLFVPEPKKSDLF